MTGIAQQAFRFFSNLTDIQFNGTTAQWNAITFASYWNDRTGDYTAYCTDGTISKDGTVTVNG